VVELVFLVHLGATLAMVGLIWLVQVAQYPLLATVSPAGFKRFHDRYLRVVTWVVGPFMLVEVGTALVLLELAPEWFPAPALWTGVGLVALIWLSTALLQVPLHRRLELGGYDVAAIERLVRTNWLRTLAWSARGVLLLWVAAGLLGRVAS
jgi:hypothetical protein